MPLRIGSVGTFVLALVVSGAAGYLTAGAAGAGLERPVYMAGDRWTYVLQSSLGTLPGFNRSGGVFGLALNGLVDVEVLGPAQASVGGMQVPGVQVATHTSGVLNGSFGFPGNATIRASGSFTGDSSEVWEGQDHLPTVSNASSTYVISVSRGIPLSLQVEVWLNASTEYASLPTFNLSVGDTAEAPFTSEVSVATAATAFGFSAYNRSRGTVVGTWSRQVLAAENVTVEAGTFSTYRLNESLGSFPGLGVMVPGTAANETAWFSNSVGYYVKREAFVNGTPVAEMQLQSYTYPASPGGFTLPQIALIVGVAILAVTAVVLFLFRRRRGKREAVTDGTAGPVGELPPKPGGGP